MFGIRRATVAAPSRQPPTPSDNGADTIPPATGGLDQLRESAESPRDHQLERDLALVADELVWLKERFTKLQNRVTAELREIRREVDRLYDAPEEEETDDELQR